MRRRTSLVTCLLLVSSLIYMAACEAPEDPAARKGADADDVRVCDIMPLAAIGEAVGADPGEIVPVEGDSLCRYSWPYGFAQIGPISVAPSREAAAGLFENTFGGQLQGPDGHASRSVEQIAGVGDRAVYDGGVEFEDDEVHGRTASVRSTMWVLYQNVVVQVGANYWQPRTPEQVQDGPSEEYLDRNRETTVILGRQLVAYLARQQGGA